MPAKRPFSDHTKPQRERFIDTARQLECDEDKGRFEEKMKRIVKVKPAPKNQETPAKPEPTE